MSKNVYSNQTGVAHLGLVLVLIVFVAVGSLVYWRFSSSDTAKEEVNISQVDEQSAEETLQSELEASADNIEQDTATAAEDGDSGEGLTDE